MPSLKRWGQGHEEERESGSTMFRSQEYGMDAVDPGEPSRPEKPGRECKSLD